MEKNIGINGRDGSFKSYKVGCISNGLVECRMKEGTGEGTISLLVVDVKQRLVDYYDNDELFDLDRYEHYKLIIYLLFH